MAPHVTPLAACSTTCGALFSWKPWTNQLPISYNDKQHATATPQNPFKQKMPYQKLLQTYCSGSTSPAKAFL